MKTLRTSIAIATLSIVTLAASSVTAQADALSASDSMSGAGAAASTVIIYQPEDLGFDRDGPTVTFWVRRLGTPGPGDVPDQRRRRQLDDERDVLVSGYVDGVLVAQSLVSSQSLQVSDDLTTGSIDRGGFGVSIPGPDGYPIELRLRLAQGA